MGQTNKVPSKPEGNNCYSFAPGLRSANVFSERNADKKVSDVAREEQKIIIVLNFSAWGCRGKDDS